MEVIDDPAPPEQHPLERQSRGRNQLNSAHAANLRVGFRCPVTGRHYVFLTNNFKLSARTIADIYKDRWQVELFFKAIKQNLKIKAFVGTSRNGILTQLWIAQYGIRVQGHGRDALLHQPLGQVQDQAGKSVAMLLRQVEPGVQYGIRVQGHGRDALLQQPLGQVRMI